MMETNDISQYMLELYQLGLASPKERKLVEAALASDPELRLRYEALVESDHEIRKRYPLENMPAPAVFKDAVVTAREPGFSGQGAIVRGRFSGRTRLFVGLGAAAVFVCVLFFSLINLRNLGKRPTEIASVPDNGTVWARGTENHVRDFSISIYPMEPQAELSQIEYEDGLPNGTPLKEGDSLRVAYTTPSGGDYEGVIFYINGRPGSDVTLFFPDNIRDRPKLTSGREDLRKRHTLDPDTKFEIFFFVASQNPLNTEAIIKIANEVAAGDLSDEESGRNLETVIGIMYSAFEGYEVKHSYIYVTK
jgi:hypothetical protein